MTPSVTSLIFSEGVIIIQYIVGEESGAFMANNIKYNSSSLQYRPVIKDNGVTMATRGECKEVNSNNHVTTTMGLLIPSPAHRPTFTRTNKYTRILLVSSAQVTNPPSSSLSLHSSPKKELGQYISYSQPQECDDGHNDIHSFVNTFMAKSCHWKLRKRQSKPLR